MLGQRSFLRTPQDANISVAIPIIAINFAFFMISELIHKINAFEGISIALCEINLQKSHEKTPPIAEIQKIFAEFTPIALEQYKLRNKAESKLPSFCSNGCLFWQRSLEQATSETVAQWKSKFFPTQRLLSVTGGFGVDEWAWNRSGTEVISCDIQADLNALVRFNQQKLDIQYNRYDCDALTLLNRNKTHSGALVYVDPDRRDGNNRLSGYWENFQPRIDQLIKEFGTNYTNWLIKMSPMTDFRVLRDVIPGAITFYSIFFQGEVKELLLHINTESKMNTKRLAVHLSNSGDAHFFDSNEINRFINVQSKDNPETSNGYIFEPHGGINNLNLNSLLIDIPQLKSLTPQHTLFESKIRLPQYWGRTKAILTKFDGSLNNIHKQLRNLGITAASVTARNTRGIKAETIKKKLGLEEGDKHTMFVTHSKNGFQAWLTLS